MRAFDKFILALETTLEKAEKVSLIPKWNGPTPPAAVKKYTRLDWPGVLPGKWTGLPITDHRLFNANNAGPFEFTVAWQRSYDRLPVDKKLEVEAYFNDFLNKNPQQRVITVQVKKAKKLAKRFNMNFYSVWLWQMGHDLYTVFVINNQERNVKWLNLYDDHDRLYDDITE